MLACFVPANATPSLELKYQFCAPEPLRALRDLSRTPKLFAIADAVYQAKNPFPRAKSAKHWRHRRKRSTAPFVRSGRFANRHRTTARA
jgi:hypothetical protein